MMAESNTLPRSTRNPPLGFSGSSKARMTAVVQDLPPAAVLADRAAVDGEGTLADEPLLHQLVDHRRHAAGAVVVLAQVLARRLQIDQQRHLIAVLLPVIERQLHAHVPGDRRSCGSARWWSRRWRS